MANEHQMRAKSFLDFNYRPCTSDGLSFLLQPTIKGSIDDFHLAVTGVTSPPFCTNGPIDGAHKATHPADLSSLTSAKLRGGPIIRSLDRSWRNQDVESLRQKKVFAAKMCATMAAILQLKCPKWASSYRPQSLRSSTDRCQCTAVYSSEKRRGQLFGS